MQLISFALWLVLGLTIASGRFAVAETTVMSTSNEEAIMKITNLLLPKPAGFTFYEGTVVGDSTEWCMLRLRNLQRSGAPVDGVTLELYYPGKNSIAFTLMQDTTYTSDVRVLQEDPLLITSLLSDPSAPGAASSKQGLNLKYNAGVVALAEISLQAPGAAAPRKISCENLRRKN